MKSGTRREEEDQRERGLIPGGMGCFLEEMGPGWGSSSLRKSASDTGRGGGGLHGMSVERRAGREAAEAGRRAFGTSHL